MAYNGPGYVDLTQLGAIKPDQEYIVDNSETGSANIEAMRRNHSNIGSSPKFPYCIVWTPIPFITYLFPFIGHMGICKEDGAIRDFAASYYVSENNMAFGNPTKIVQLDPGKVNNNIGWDTAVEEAAQVYEHRIHNLCCDNCHSMVALALNKMQYNGRSNWNMVNVWALFVWQGKYLNFMSVVKTLAPFCIILIGIALLYVLFMY